jgi:hypothetical protein
MIDSKENKKLTGVWIDGKKAIIVSLSGKEENVSQIESAIENSHHHFHEGDPGTFMGNHHINHERKFNERKKHQTDQFIDQVFTAIRDSDELYIIGPSLFKNHLANRILNENGAAPRLRVLAASEYLTLNQCVGQVKNFFASASTN